MYATRSRAIGQTLRPPMLAQALIQFEGGHASLVFDAHVPFGHEDHTYIAGTQGTIISAGPNLGEQTPALYTRHGIATPTLEGNWFPDGFHGSMGELLCAIEERREPINSARENLQSLGLCFAAIASAGEGVAKIPEEVRQLPHSYSLSKQAIVKPCGVRRTLGAKRLQDGYVFFTRPSTLRHK